MILANIFNNFILFSIVGWIYECIYCTIQTGHWQNRGFLFGPICPIYGTGAVLILALSYFYPDISNGHASLWACFLIFLVGSAMLEYSVSWVLERIFRARWWDYSEWPLNLNGRICLPASLFFGVVGIFLLRCLIPLSTMLLSKINPVILEASALLSMGLLGADVSLSIASMSALLETLDRIETDVNKKIESGVQFARQIPLKVSYTSEKALNTMSEATERAGDAARHIIQRHHLNNISKFMKTEHTNSADYIKRFIQGIRKSDNDDTY